MKVFDRGEIVLVRLDPTVGHEQRGKRPALALTTQDIDALGDVPPIVAMA